jgi:hypothetical protein
MSLIVPYSTVRINFFAKLLLFWEIASQQMSNSKNIIISENVKLYLKIIISYYSALHLPKIIPKYVEMLKVSQILFFKLSAIVEKNMSTELRLQSF